MNEQAAVNRLMSINFNSKYYHTKLEKSIKNTLFRNYKELSDMDYGVLLAYMVMYHDSIKAWDYLNICRPVSKFDIIGNFRYNKLVESYKKFNKTKNPTKELIIEYAFNFYRYRSYDYTNDEYDWLAHKLFGYITNDDMSKPKTLFQNSNVLIHVKGNRLYINRNGELANIGYKITDVLNIIW